MNKNFDNEIKEMQRLINYGNDKGVNESKNSGSIVEYQTKGADGKTYGIIRECNKFYIKVAPKKDTEVLSEDFDYIGGFNNKKFNEYSTYTMASKQLDLKLKSINEACNSKIETSQFSKTQPSEWQINETKEMRQDIDRFYELMNNVSKILKEDKESSKHTLPEAPAKNPSDEKVNSPYVSPATADGHKEVNLKETDHEKAGGPFENQPKVDMQSDKKPSTPGDNGIPFTQKPSFGPKFDKANVVADKNPSGGKVTRADESVRRTVKLTEEQVLAWNRQNKDYMDKSHGTEIGDSAPFDDEVNVDNDRNLDTEYHMNEDVAVHNTDNQNSPTPGTGDAQSKTEPFDDEVVVEMEMSSDETMLNDSEEDYVDDDFVDIDVDDDSEFDVDIDDSAAYGNTNLGFDPNDPSVLHPSIDTLLDDEFDDYPFESKRRRNKRVNEGIVLHDFGKHPAYQKEVMTLPPNKEINRWGRDWNDDSTKGEEPFGKKIGSSAPFTEKVVDMITDAVMNQFFKKKV